MGARNKFVNLIAGSWGCGKTSHAVKTALEAARKGRVIYICTEESIGDIRRRLYGALIGKQGHEINAEDSAAINRAAKGINIRFAYAKTIDEMLRLLEMANGGNDTLADTVIIDGVQTLALASTLSVNSALALLKWASEHYGFDVYATYQLNKNGELDYFVKKLSYIKTTFI